MKDFRINREIRSPKVVIIDDTGNNLGVLKTEDALQIAREKELDLVEVSPNIDPPVCKIMDYGKHRYKVSKQNRQHNAKQKKVETKKVRISIRTEDHDLEFKSKNAIKFMTKGHKVKVELPLRGREKANIDFANDKLVAFIENIKKITKLDPKTEEKEIITIQKIEKSPQGLSTLIEFKKN